MRILLAIVAVCLAPVAGAAPFVEYAAPCTAPAWQPGGALLACTLDVPRENVTRAGVLILGADGKERAFVLGPMGRFAWRPDGKLLAAVSQRAGASSLFFFNPEGQQGTLAPVGLQIMDPLAWVPDGREVWFAHPATLMRGRTDITGTTADGSPSSLRGMDGYCTDCASPAFASDGRLAHIHPPDTILVVDRRPDHLGEPKKYVFPVTDSEMSKDYRFMQGPSWSPDGRYLAVITWADKQSATLQVLDTRAAGGKFVALGRTVGDIAWSPGSDEVATSVEQPPRGATRVVAVRVAGGKRRDLVVPEAGCVAQMPAWSSTGLAVVVGCTGSVRLRIYPPPR